MVTAPGSGFRSRHHARDLQVDVEEDLQGFLNDLLGVAFDHGFSELEHVLGVHGILFLGDPTQ